jgi:lipopolysaccharide/colanic/teichoic acid biosynthesis glycosyltransferase
MSARHSVMSDDIDSPHHAADATAVHEEVRWRPNSATIRLRTFSYPIAFDTLCIVFSFALVALARGRLFTETGWAFVLALILPCYLVIALNGKVYSVRLLTDPLQSVGRTIKAYLIAVAMMTLAGFYLKATELPRLTVALGSILSIVLLAVSRYYFVRYRRRIVGGEPYSVALIWEPGQPIPAVDFSVRIAAEGFIDPQRHDPLMYDRLAAALNGVHNVVVSCHPDRRDAWTHALKGACIQSEILMPELQPLAPLAVSTHGAMTALVVSHGPLNLIDRAIKRVFDLAIAIPAMVLLSPLFLVVALLIKAESKGPVFFHQDRIGRSNRVFRVFKFRSMTAASTDSHGVRSASRDDDRITRVGKFIRRTSIDELPQLLNVLSGTMSIVGPRPHALGSRAADKLFWEVDGRYWHRHAAKPGLTGLAQVRGYRGATIMEDDLRNRLQADLEYLDTWSIWRDVKIIVMTFQVMIHKNAF